MYCRVLHWPISQKSQRMRPTNGISRAAPGPDVSSLKAKRAVRRSCAAGALHLTQRSGRIAPSLTTIRLPRTKAPLTLVAGAAAAVTGAARVDVGAFAVLPAPAT